MIKVMVKYMAMQALWIVQNIWTCTKALTGQCGNLKEELAFFTLDSTITSCNIRNTLWDKRCKRCT